MSSPLATTQAIFATNAAVFDRTLQGISQENWLAQPGPDSNHLLWIAGHVVVHREKVLKLLAQQWSSPWEPLFARGVKRGLAEQYPRPDEVLREWTDLCERVAVSLAGATSELLGKPAAQGLGHSTAPSAGRYPF
jgi:hypothetical protein